MVSLIVLILTAAASFWVYKDANANGMNGIVWGIFTFLMLIIGLPAYLVMKHLKLKEGGANDSGADDILDDLLDDKTV